MDLQKGFIGYQIKLYNFLCFIKCTTLKKAMDLHWYKAVCSRGVTANVLVLLHYAIHLSITNTPNCHYHDYIQWYLYPTLGARPFKEICYS